MRKLLKIVLVLLALFIPISLGLYGIKKLFPKDFNDIENNAKLALVKKMPFLGHFLIVKTETGIQKEVIVTKAPAPVVEVIDYYTNKDVYKAICADEKNMNPNNRFIGCNRCPNYIEPHNSDYFSLSSYASGTVLKKDETEAVFFMHGCTESGNIALVLRKSYGGWAVVEQYKDVSFDEPPLIFKDNQNFLFFVGKRKRSGDNVDKETLFSLTFKNNKLHTKDIFSIHSTSSLKCTAQFLAGMESPYLLSENKFAIQLDVMGWQETVHSDCKFPSRNLHVRLKPGAYTLNFTQKHDAVFGDKDTQRIMTELEKAQE
jgi:hypothetical protein